MEINFPSNDKSSSSKCVTAFRFQRICPGNLPAVIALIITEYVILNPFPNDKF